MEKNTTVAFPVPVRPAAGGGAESESGVVGEGQVCA